MYRQTTTTGRDHQPHTDGGGRTHAGDATPDQRNQRRGTERGGAATRRGSGTTTGTWAQTHATQLPGVSHGIHHLNTSGPTQNFFLMNAATQYLI